MIYLRQSTASQEVPLGYFVDSTDGNTEKTGLTIAASDILIWKSGATSLATKNSGGATHISNGIYYAVLDATDTNTIGPMVIFVHVSGALTVRLECCVLDEAFYDMVTQDGISAITRFLRAAKGMTLGTVGSASTTTSVVTSSLDPAAAVTDQFKGKILTFTDDTTTANLRGQSTDITSSSSGGVLTVTALTTAPASGDLFTIA